MMASLYGQLDTVKYLHQSGADMIKQDCVSIRSVSPVCLAVVCILSLLFVSHIAWKHTSHQGQYEWPLGYCEVSAPERC
jgi:predicted transporter